MQRTILEECWKPVFARVLVPTVTGLRRDLEQSLVDDHTERAYILPGGKDWTAGRTPDEVLGTTSIWLSVWRRCVARSPGQY